MQDFQIIKREYQFQGDFGAIQNQFLTVRLPALNQLPRQVEGDWGPMYQFQLKGHEPICIGHGEQWQELPQSTLRLESPMNFLQRKKTPLFIVLEDAMNQCEIRLYLDAEGQLVEVASVDQPGIRSRQSQPRPLPQPEFNKA